jgi:hypothetical protein
MSICGSQLRGELASFAASVKLLTKQRCNPGSDSVYVVSIYCLVSSATVSNTRTFSPEATEIDVQQGLFGEPSSNLTTSCAGCRCQHQAEQFHLLMNSSMAENQEESNTKQRWRAAVLYSSTVDSSVNGCVGIDEVTEALSPSTHDEALADRRSCLHSLVPVYPTLAYNLGPRLLP